MNLSSESPAGGASSREHADRISTLPMPDYSLYADRDLIAVAGTVDGNRFPERLMAIRFEMERRGIPVSVEHGVKGPPMSRPRILFILRIIGGLEIAVSALAMAFALLAGVNGWFSGQSPFMIVVSLVAVITMLVAGILTCFGSRIGITLSMILAFLQLIGQLPLPFPSARPVPAAASSGTASKGEGGRFRYEMILDIAMLITLGYLGTQLRRRDEEARENEP